MGTHPIFESDFDCLTEMGSRRSRSKSRDRDRKRKKERKRSRSRSKDRKRERKRSRSRDRKRSRERKRSRSKEKTKVKERSRSKSPVVKIPDVVVKEFKPENVKKEPKDEKKLSRFSGRLEAFKKARAMSPSAQPKPDPDAPLAPAKVEIPGFPKAMAGVQVFKPEKLDVNVDSVDIAGKFDLANLAKEMMDRRKRVERWRREQKRKVMVEVHEEVKEEKRRQRKAAMEDKSNPWVEDDESAEEAEIDAVKVKKGDEDKMQLDENEDEDPLDAYMSSL